MKVIQVENLSKQYRLGLVSSRTITADFHRVWARIRGKEDPTLTIGVENRIDTVDGEYIWALKDINFEVEEGEVLGIIGKNGAGKSTLLKILSKVTGPTTGNVKMKGRIASLLEVGTGFHPELTGKENIFLNGAILGMTKAEIRRKFDEIVDFSGVGKYIDTPVKRYSSGMYVRLAFAVAAHLEPEILIIDEVLAVGDAEFQKKCLGKMKDVSKQGRTVLFVSHNMTAIENLCHNVIILKNGIKTYSGNVNEGVSLYLKDFVSKENYLIENFEDDLFALKGFKIHQETDSQKFLTIKPIEVQIEYEIKKETIGLRIGFDLLDFSTGTVVFQTFNDENFDEISFCKPGNYTSRAIIPGNLLKEGSYVVSLAIGDHNIKWLTKDTIKKTFDLVNIGGINKAYAYNGAGVIMPYIDWNNVKD